MSEELTRNQDCRGTARRVWELNREGQPCPRAGLAADAAKTARQLIRRAKRATRRRFPAEEKIRIVMEGVRAEVSVADLCRARDLSRGVLQMVEGFHGRRARGGCGETPSEKATSHEVQDLRQENERLKLLVGGFESRESDTEKKAQY